MYIYIYISGTFFIKVQQRFNPPFNWSPSFYNRLKRKKLLDIFIKFFVAVFSPC